MQEQAVVTMADRRPRKQTRHAAGETPLAFERDGATMVDLVQRAREQSRGPYGELLQLNALVVMADSRVEEAQGRTIRTRWECGRWLLARREGQAQLPPGVLDEAAAVCHVSRKEMTRRLALATLYPTEEELGHAVSKFPSWHQMAARGLRTERPSPAPDRAGALVKAVQRVAHAADQMDVSAIPDAQRRSLVATLERLLGVLASYEMSAPVVTAEGRDE